jgi:hypothetical protein
MAQDEMEVIERKQRILQQALRDRAIKLSWTDPKVSALEAAISRGDRRIGGAIEAAWRMGSTFDAWNERFDFERWQRAFQEAGIAIHDYANTPLGFDAPLAWDHVDCGNEKDALRREAERALSVEAI